MSSDFLPTELVIVTTTRTGRKKVFHTEECMAVEQAKNYTMKQYKHVSDRNLCSYCSGESVRVGTRPFMIRGELYCRHCWGELDGAEAVERGLCGFCYRCELVHMHPRDEPVTVEDRLV